MDLHPGEEIVFEGHPSWRSILGFYMGGLALAALAGAIGGLADSAGLGAGIAAVIFAVVLGVGLLKRIGTRYVITNQRLHIRRGILSRRVQQTQVDRVQNVNTDQSLLERLLRVGTVDFDTAGTDDSDFIFAGVANPTEVVAAVDRAQRQAPRAETTEGPPA
jgi:uncharacterized membrane protein YdbT with pleckstrin-like domain